MQLPDELIRQYAASLKRGSVLYWQDYRFRNGTKRDKMVLLLSNCQKGKFYLVVLPTSQLQHYVEDRREMTDVVCFPRDTSTWFKVDTIIDLKNREVIEVEKLIPHLASKAAILKTILDETDMGKIDEAVRNAVTLSPRDQKMILEE